MFAVIKSGGKQYKVAQNDVIVVESLLGEPGATVELPDVLMIGGDGKEPSIGAPFLDKAAVTAEVVEQSRAPKIIVFKKKRRKGYRRKAGHRQNQTVLRITSISASGMKAPAKAKAPAKEKAPVKAETPEEKAAKPKAAAKKSPKKSKE